MVVTGWAFALLLILALLCARWPRWFSWIVALGASVPWLLGLCGLVSIVWLAAGHTFIALADAGIVAVAVAIRLAPPRKSRQPIPAPPSGNPTLRIYCANLWDRGDPQYLAAEISELDPDVVILQELTPAHLDRLESASVLAAFPWKLVSPRRGGEGMGLWSRVETSGTKWWHADGLLQVRTLLTVPGGPVLSFYGVHLPTPLLHGVKGWRVGLASLRHELQHEASEYTVVAGDFNATWDHGPFRSLLTLGLRDAAVERHGGWQMTWPRVHRLLPCLLRIDHVLVSENLKVLDYRLGRGRGSDHRPVVVDLAWAPVATPGPPASLQSQEIGGPITDVDV